jgi:hypothetical protein
LLLVATRSANRSQDETTAVSSNRKIPSHRKMRVSGHDPRDEALDEKARPHGRQKHASEDDKRVPAEGRQLGLWSSMTAKRDARPIARLITASTINGASDE